MSGGGGGWGSEFLRWRSGSSLCDDFQIACYVLTTGPKTNQDPSFT